VEVVNWRGNNGIECTRVLAAGGSYFSFVYFVGRTWETYAPVVFPNLGRCCYDARGRAKNIPLNGNIPRKVYSRNTSRRTCTYGIQISPPNEYGVTSVRVLYV